jgi:HAD superfamily hydrolase (TIGR01509 family)
VSALRRAPGERGAALLLDLDGVLFESEPLHQEAWERSAASLGAQLPEGWYAGQRGRSLMAVAAAVAAYAPGVPAREIAHRKCAAFLELAAGLPPAPGVTEVLGGLGLRAAVVSSSRAEDVFVLIRGSPLEPHLETVVTGSDSPVHKPAPDLYLLAMQRLGLDAGRCAAVEDSESGVRSALAAGLRVVAVADRAAAFPAATASCGTAAEAIRAAGALLQA